MLVLKHRETTALWMDVKDIWKDHGLNQVIQLVDSHCVALVYSVVGPGSKSYPHFLWKTIG